MLVVACKKAIVSDCIEPKFLESALCCLRLSLSLIVLLSRDTLLRQHSSTSDGELKIIELNLNCLGTVARVQNKNNMI